MFAARTCNLCRQMSKNKIGLHILFALLGLGISLLLLGFGAQFVMQMEHFDSNNREVDLLGTMLTCVAGVVCLVFSVALLLRLEWARIAFQVLLILGGIAWLAFIAFLAAESPQAWAALTGLGAAGLMIVLFGVLFLDSRSFREDLSREKTATSDHLDILDH